MGTAQGLRGEQTERLVFIVLLGVYTLVLIRTAWVGDDAYISFRTIDNFVNGYGLRWNVAERVWSFTNPLWVLLLSPIYALTGEIYYTVLVVSLLLSVATVWLVLLRLAHNLVGVVFAALALIFSKAFVDYSTSGLENPLSHFLFVLFLLVLVSTWEGKRRLFSLSLVAALAVLNRYDTALIYGPVLLAEGYRQGWKAAIRPMLVGCIPFVVWEAFAWFYYGFPLPNTYYAKLKAGIPAVQSIKQGFIYLLDSLALDPLTLLLIGSAVVMGTLCRGWRRLLSVGIVLYLIYIVRAGGDFMSGRCLALPLMASVVLLIELVESVSRGRQLATLGAIVVVGLGGPRVSIWSGPGFGQGKEGKISPQGIADERGCYFQTNGLLNLKRHEQMPAMQSAQDGRELRAKKAGIVYAKTVGQRGYYAGPGVTIIDVFGLTDPLVARLPISPMITWRIGHLDRTVPYGYRQSIETGEARFDDSNIAAYWQQLRRLTYDSLWSWDRIVTIVRFSLGEFDPRIDAYAMTPVIEKKYAQISRVMGQGMPWKARGVTAVRQSGLRVFLDKLHKDAGVEISVDHNDQYHLLFFRDSVLCGRAQTRDSTIESGGLRVDTVAVPKLAMLGGYDRIDVYPCLGDDRYAVGHLRLLKD